MAADPNCKVCGGTGEVETEASIINGTLRDADIRPCYCTKEYNANEEDEDRHDPYGGDNESDSDSEDTGF